MIDLKDFRENPDRCRHAAEVKRVNVDVDHVLQLDGERLRGQQAFERPTGGRSVRNAAVQETVTRSARRETNSAKQDCHPALAIRRKAY
jgi:seryl-tRNA synthetase